MLSAPRQTQRLGWILCQLIENYNFSKLLTLRRCRHHHFFSENIQNKFLFVFKNNPHWGSFFFLSEYPASGQVLHFHSVHPLLPPRVSSQRADTHSSSMLYCDSCVGIPWNITWALEISLGFRQHFNVHLSSCHNTVTVLKAGFTLVCIYTPVNRITQAVSRVSGNLRALSGVLPPRHNLHP